MKKMVSPIEAINAIGLFSKKNLAFVNSLKKKNIEFESIKKAKKNTIIVSGCKVIFDYDYLVVKTSGKCGEIEKLLEDKS